MKRSTPSKTVSKRTTSSRKKTKPLTREEFLKFLRYREACQKGYKHASKSLKTMTWKKFVKSLHTEALQEIKKAGISLRNTDGISSFVEYSSESTQRLGWYIWLYDECYVVQHGDSSGPFIDEKTVAQIMKLPLDKVYKHIEEAYQKHLADQSLAPKRVVEITW